MKLLRVINFSVILAVTLLGCKAAPMTNTIVSQAENPDGLCSAVLVERYYHAALNANRFYLLIISKEQDQSRALNDKDIDDSSALVATKASKVVLKWQDSGTLLVICASCGIGSIDVNKKLDRLESAKIIYQGFPKQTAYS